MKLNKKIWAGILGNCLELYDYALYGYLAAILAGQFFPQGDPAAALLATYGIYASGFILRPVGALLFGSIGDRYGRKRALEISVLMMAIPTLLIGLLPTYAQIGLFAPLLLTLMRFLQGISVGGELVGSYAFLIEHAAPNEKGYAGSWSIVGCTGGKLLGTFVAGVVSLVLTVDQLQNWGWRIPFILGLFFAIAGYLLRKQVEETPTFLELKSSNAISKTPLRDSIQQGSSQILYAIGAMMVNTSALHLLFVYFTTYLVAELHVDYTYSLASNFIALVVSMIFLPIGAKLSDKKGRRPVMLGASLLLVLLIYPGFTLISTAQVPIIIMVQSTFAIVFSFLYGPLPAFLSELFPARIRYTSSAIAYNICVGVVGGFSPFIATYLISVTGSPVAPALWLIFCGSISIFTLSRQPSLEESQI